MTHAIELPAYSKLSNPIDALPRTQLLMNATVKVRFGKQGYQAGEGVRVFGYLTPTSNKFRKTGLASRRRNSRDRRYIEQISTNRISEPPKEFACSAPTWKKISKNRVSEPAKDFACSAPTSHLRCVRERNGEGRGEVSIPYGREQLRTISKNSGSRPLKDLTSLWGKIAIAVFVLEQRWRDGFWVLITSVLICIC